jgi:hypothetical protein
MLLPNELEVPRQLGFHRRRQHRDPVLVALAAPYHDLIGEALTFASTASDDRNWVISASPISAG